MLADYRRNKAEVLGIGKSSGAFTALDGQSGYDFPAVALWRPLHQENALVGQFRYPESEPDKAGESLPARFVGSKAWRKVRKNENASEHHTWRICQSILSSE